MAKSEEAKLGDLLLLIMELESHTNTPFADMVFEFNKSYIETFRLAAFGFTNREIADKQNITPSNVGTRLYILKKTHEMSKSDLTKQWFEDYFDIMERMAALLNEWGELVKESIV